MLRYLSPLRYPGGKNKFYPQIQKIILDNGLYKCTYAEPFAGGVGIGLRLLSSGIVSKLYINDLDMGVYAFWHSVLQDYNEFLLLLQNTPISIEEREKQVRIYHQNKDGNNLLLLGFAFFYLNRTNRSGIIDGGPIGGYSQNSRYKIDCRFNKSDLAERIAQIHSFKDQIIISQMDASDFIEKQVPTITEKKFLFVDPPYFVKGNKLYLNSFSLEDHQNLRNTIVRCLSEIPYVITYDAVNEIREIYEGFSIRNYKLQYSAGKKGFGEEIIIYDSKKIKMVFPD